MTKSLIALLLLICTTVGETTICVDGGKSIVCSKIYDTVVCQ